MIDKHGRSLGLGLAEQHRELSPTHCHSSVRALTLHSQMRNQILRNELFPFQNNIYTSRKD